MILLNYKKSLDRLVPFLSSFSSWARIAADDDYTKKNDGSHRYFKDWSSAKYGGPPQS